VKARPPQTRPAIRPAAGRSLTLYTAALLLAIFPGSMQAQATGSLAAAQSQSDKSAQPAAKSPPAAPPKKSKPAKPPTSSARRHAAKAYLQAGKQFLAGKFDEARRGFEHAAQLDPTNSDYRQAAAIARNHEVTALLQASAKDRLLNNHAAARAALLQAYDLDPKNFQVSEHLDRLGADAARSQPPSIYGEVENTLGGPVQLDYATAQHSFHIRANQRQIIEQVFKAFGIEAIFDQSVGVNSVRMDLGDASFHEATRALGMITDTFYVPLDPHRVLVARDTPPNREEFMRLSLETVYLPGLSSDTMTQVTNLARNIFGAQSVAPDATTGTLTLRAPQLDLEAFNATMRQLLDGSSQIMLDVRMMQIAHTHTRNTGVVPPQSISAFNVYAEEQAILNANQDLVQQIISSGLAAPGDTLAILGILLASGAISNPLFSNGFALFGGGITQSALVPGTLTANFALNSSDSRELDDVHLRLGDGESGTLKLGSRYPIETSSYSSLSSTAASIPGLNTAGTSSSLTSLLSQLTESVPTVPQVQYQDLGLTLKVTPRVMRNGNVALTLDLDLDSLAGSSINGLPVLNNRAYSGVVMLKEGSAAVVAGDMDLSQSRAVTGTPGLSELPGMNNVTGKETQQDYATLLIVITPHVIRGTQAAGHSPMFRIVSATPLH
jgi:general secretion pathway protein D